MRARLLALAALAVAALSLVVLPRSLTYDAWSWLSFGRQLAHGSLDLGGATSWKPLPALVDVALAPLGSLAPWAWLFLARLASAACVVLAAALAVRWSPRPQHRMAAGLAVVAVVGAGTFVRSALDGSSEPVAAAALLGAALAWTRAGERSGPPAATVGLLAIAALVRPEAGVLLLVAVALTVRLGARRLCVGLAAVAAVGVAWLVPPLLATGEAADPSTSPLVRTTGPGATAAALATAAPLALVLVALGVLALDGRARRLRSAPVAALGAALVWGATTFGSTLVGLPAPRRFLLPAAVLAAPALGALASRLAGPWRTPRTALLASVAVGLCTIAALAPQRAPARRAHDDARAAARLSASWSELDGRWRSALGGGVQACTIEPLRSQVAWRIDVLPADVCSGPGFGVTPRDPTRDAVVLAPGGAPLDDLVGPGTTGAAGPLDGRWRVIVVAVDP